MPDLSLGIILISITLLGYISNWLNWKYLDYHFMHWLYYVGAFVHETSHAALCVVTGATIEEFVVFSDQPHVTHQKSRLPLLGEPLIAFAPIAGGLLFLFLVNHYVLRNHFVVPQFSLIGMHWQIIFKASFAFLGELRLFSWQSWVMAFLFFNVGAMIGPSFQDLKNIWLPVILLFFVQSPFLANWGLHAVVFIIANIILQLFVIFGLWLYHFMFS